MAEIPEKLIPVYIEKYKILWAAFDNEMGRFWQRYNILISIQIIAISLFKLTETTTVEPLVQIFIYFALSLFSFITFLIVQRAIDVYKFNLRMIKDYEEANSHFVLLTKETTNHVDVMEPTAYYYARIIPIVLFVAWFSIMTYQICDVYKL